MLAVDESLPTGTFVELRGAIVAARGANDALAPADIASAPGHEALLVSGYTFREATAETALDVLAASGARWRAIDAGGVPDGTDLSAANVLLGTLGRAGGERDEVPEALALRLLERSRSSPSSSARQVRWPPPGARPFVCRPCSRTARARSARATRSTPGCSSASPAGSTSARRSCSASPQPRRHIRTRTAVGRS